MTEQQPGGAVKCGGCKGDGVCKQCQGKGLVANTHRFAADPQKNCQRCNGTGNCAGCGGSGWIVIPITIIQK